MTPEVRQAIDRIWHLSRIDDLQWSRAGQHAAEENARAGHSRGPRLAHITAGYYVELIQKAGAELREEVKKVVEAHDATISGDERTALESRLSHTLGRFQQDGLGRLTGLTTDNRLFAQATRTALLAHYNEACIKNGQRAQHDFGLMLAGFAPGRRKPESASTTFNVLGHNYGQVGNQNQQKLQMQVQAFRDLAAGINRSEAAPEQKEEAKGLLRQLLTHPIVTSFAEGLGEGVADLLKPPGT